MTLKEAEEYIAESLLTLYDKEEAKAIARIVIQHCTGFSNVEYSLHLFNEFPEDIQVECTKALDRLKSGEPVQYVTGIAYFYGLEFKVGPDVLIPRRETEELVEKIIKENQDSTDLSILDIGTGSGSIPIVLKKNLKNAHVVSIDISIPALEIAKQNAKLNDVEIYFYHVDILNQEIPGDELFDIVVSNPPYVPEIEKDSLHTNVLNHEPHTALFVPDADALLFYKRIADLAWLRLKPGGKLYFEIHETKGSETKLMLKEKGYYDIRVSKDMQNKDRMVVASR